MGVALGILPVSQGLVKSHENLDISDTANSRSKSIAWLNAAKERLGFKLIVIFVLKVTFLILFWNLVLKHQHVIVDANAMSSAFSVNPKN